jgi:hypothetical protein
VLLLLTRGEGAILTTHSSSCSSGAHSASSTVVISADDDAMSHDHGRVRSPDACTSGDHGMSLCVACTPCGGKVIGGKGESISARSGVALHGVNGTVSFVCVSVSLVCVSWRLFV